MYHILIRVPSLNLQSTFLFFRASGPKLVSRSSENDSMCISYQNNKRERKKTRKLVFLSSCWFIHSSKIFAFHLKGSISCFVYENINIFIPDVIFICFCAIPGC